VKSELILDFISKNEMIPEPSCWLRRYISITFTRSSWWSFGAVSRSTVAARHAFWFY